MGNSGSTLRRLRESEGLTQSELASLAGVSRQLVGAVEAGRHQPRVDAALALAAALGVEVAAIFGSMPRPVDVLTGDPPPEGAVVRAGRVGDQLVTTSTRLGFDGFDVADGVVDHGIVTPFGRTAPGLVVAGCEPGLEVLESLLREQGMGALSVTSSSAVALGALASGRVHAAVVHGAADHLEDLSAGLEVERFRLTLWRVGLAAPPDSRVDWWQSALAGRGPVVQREPEAGVQQVFERSVHPGIVDVVGPRVTSHLEAARWAVIAGIPAVTIEPAALAVDAVFHPLDMHEAQIWCAPAWVRDRCVTEALDVIVGRRFQRGLEAIGGYDLTGCGSRAA